MRWLPAVVLAACGSGARATAPSTVENQVAAQAPAEDGPLSREIIAGTTAPPDQASTLRLLIGAWHGRRYAYDSEHDFAGPAGEGMPDQLWFASDGYYRERLDGCDSDGTYQVTWQPEGIELRIYRVRTCEGEPPYDWPMYVHGLDAGVLVLVDGMTGGVHAYRRGAQ